MGLLYCHFDDKRKSWVTTLPANWSIASYIGLSVVDGSDAEVKGLKPAM